VALHDVEADPSVIRRPTADRVEPLRSPVVDPAPAVFTGQCAVRGKAMRRATVELSGHDERKNDFQLVLLVARTHSRDRCRRTLRFLRFGGRKTNQ
jgi:hypothetical protein